MIVGFTNGCFDLLHDGHRHFLTQCKLYCEHLVVGIDADSRVRRLKGEGRPVQDLHTRMMALHALPWVNEVIPFLTEHHLQFMIGRKDPDYYFKGAEYAGKELPWIGRARVELIPMLPGFSTTSIVERMKA